MGEVWAKHGHWCYRFKFLEGIRLHWLLRAGFGEIRFLKWRDAINLNSWFLAVLKGFPEGLPLFKLRFFLKTKKDFNKDQYFMCQILTSESRSILPFASIWCKLWENSIQNMWVTPKTNRPSFCLILKFSHALDGLFSVLSRLHGRKRKCVFCWMNHHCSWLLSDVVWDSF